MTSVHSRRTRRIWWWLLQRCVRGCDLKVMVTAGPSSAATPAMVILSHDDELTVQAIQVFLKDIEARGYLDVEERQPQERTH